MPRKIEFSTETSVKVGSIWRSYSDKNSQNLKNYGFDAVSGTWCQKIYQMSIAMSISKISIDRESLLTSNLLKQYQIYSHEVKLEQFYYHRVT